MAKYFFYLYIVHNNMKRTLAMAIELLTGTFWVSDNRPLPSPQIQDIQNFWALSKVNF